MLINTVIVWLKDLLPLFIALVYVVCLYPDAKQKQKVVLSLVLGGMGGILLLSFSAAISEAFNGAGLELVLTAIYILIYSFSAYALSHSGINTLPFKVKIQSIWLAIYLLAAIKFSAFFLYLSSYQLTNNSYQILPVGMLLGLGISLSISCLLYFLLTSWSYPHQRKIIGVLVAIFFAGQFSHILPLLHQIDYLNESAPLWDSGFIVKNSSEYGQLLKTFFAYEARPSALYLMLFVSAVLFPWLLTLLSKDK